MSNLDDFGYSNQSQWVADDTENGGHYEPLTWKEVATEQQEELRELKKFQRIVRDLDRNEHGRHEGDIDSSDPTGISHGNPRLKTGDILGYALGGIPYIMPDREHRGDPDAWRKHA